MNQAKIELAKKLLTEIEEEKQAPQPSILAIESIANAVYKFRHGNKKPLFKIINTPGSHQAIKAFNRYMATA